MANKVSGNTAYVDSTGAVGPSTANVLLTSVIITPTAASAVLVLQDNAGTPVTKLDLRAATSGDSKQFLFFDNPVNFPNGLKVGTITNCVATLLLG